MYMKLYIKEITALYEMANLKSKDTGELFDIWIDEVGKDRGTKHNLPRFKPKKGNVELDIVIDNDVVRFDKQPTNKLHKFGPYKDALNFVEKFKKPLIMHWNHEITTYELGNIIRLVNKKKFTIDNAIQVVLNDDY